MTGNFRRDFTEKVYISAEVYTKACENNAAFAITGDEVNIQIPENAFSTGKDVVITFGPTDNNDTFDISFAPGDPSKEVTFKIQCDAASGTLVRVNADGSTTAVASEITTKAYKNYVEFSTTQAGTYKIVQ